MKQKIVLLSFFIITVVTVNAQQLKIAGTYKLSYTQIAGQHAITNKNKDSVLKEKIEEALVLLNAMPNLPTKEDSIGEIKYVTNLMDYQRSITYILNADGTYVKKMLEFEGTAMEIVEKGKYTLNAKTKQGQFIKTNTGKLVKLKMKSSIETTDFVYDEKTKTIVIHSRQDDEQEIFKGLQKVK
jgi:hypothetical protein